MLLLVSLRVFCVGKHSRRRARALYSEGNNWAKEKKKMNQVNRTERAHKSGPRIGFKAGGARLGFVSLAKFPIARNDCCGDDKSGAPSPPGSGSVLVILVIKVA